jgi:MFS family permease
MTSSAAPGFRSTVAALAVGQIVCWAVLFYTFTAFVLPMQRELGWSAPSLMGAYTTGLAVSAALSFAVGAAIDRGRGRAVLAWGPLVGAAGLLLWAAASHVVVLYLAWTVIGVAMAMTLYEPAFTVVTRLYPQHFREAVTAITLVGGLASTLCFPLLALLQEVFDWRQSLVALALLLAAVGALHARVLRGASIAPLPASPAAASDGAAPADAMPADATPADAFGSRAFWALTATFSSATFLTGALWAHMVPALAAKGLSGADALKVLVTVGPSQVAGRLVFLLLGRRFTLRALGLVTLAGLPLGCLLFAFGHELPVLMLFALVFGMANGVATLVRGGLLPDYFGRAAIGRIGGAMSAIAQAARAAAPLVTAWLLLLLPSYRELLLFCASVGLLGWLAFALAGRPSRVIVR